MLSTRLFCNLGYRSCSTFSSVLTVGKKYPLADAKSKQSAEPDQDGHSVSVYDMKQDKQVDLSSNPPGCDEGLSNSYQQSGHEASDRREYVTSSKKYKGDRTKQWKTDEWREEGSYHRIDRNQSKQRKPWKHNRWDEQDSGQWDSIGTSWNKSGSAWDSCESQWHKLSKPSKKSAGQRNRPSHKVHHSYSQWDQNPNNMHLRKHVEDQPTTHSQSSPDQPPDRPRGKRLRKKEKLGFIESESAPVVPDAEQLLYGLHPVSLALAAGRREVRRVYHRADARASEGRLSRVLTECAVRGVGTVPLPAAQLDRIAGGTGVHQGVCARVTPLRPRSTDELLVQAGCPPLAGEPPSTTQVDGQRTSASNFWSVETDVMASEGESQRPDDTDRRLPVSTDPGAVRSETEPPVRDPDQEKKTEVSSPEATAISDRPAHRRRVWLMLDRVHDPMNFGSIIRSSYFLGVDAVIIPDKHSCPLSPTVSKASAGTLEVFPVYSVPADSCRQLLQLLADRRWQLLAAGTDGEGQATGPISADADTLLVVGNEGRGVDPSLADLCRPWTVPPQRHLADGVESLNVGVATGILLSQLILAR